MDTETPEPRLQSTPQSLTGQAAVGASPLPSQYPIAACLTESCGKRRPSKGSLKAQTMWKSSSKDTTSCVAAPEGLHNYQPPSWAKQFADTVQHQPQKAAFSLAPHNTDLAVSNFLCELNVCFKKQTEWLVCSGRATRDVRFPFKTIMQLQSWLNSQTIKCAGCKHHLGECGAPKGQPISWVSWHLYIQNLLKAPGNPDFSIQSQFSAPSSQIGWAAAALHFGHNEDLVAVSDGVGVQSSGAALELLWSHNVAHLPVDVEEAHAIGRQL